MDDLKETALSFLKHPARLASLGRLGVHWYSAYFGAQKDTKNLATCLTDSPLDERIPIDEQAIYSYLFACLFLPASGLLFLNVLNDEEYPRVIQAYEDLIAKSKCVFLERPTRLKSRLMLTHPLTRLLQSVDGPTNCFPSLHVALVVLTYQIAKNAASGPLSVLPTLKQTCIDICRATLKTRQHSVIDVIGGVALAEQTYHRHLSGPVESLMESILPELDASELETIRQLLAQGGEPLALLDALITRFH